jgi:hypothetical protein
MDLDEGQLRTFAERYTEAWCSSDPARVAAHYAPDGSLTINDGAPSIGRPAITATAKSFMDVGRRAPPPSERSEPRHGVRVPAASALCPRAARERPHRLRRLLPAVRAAGGHRRHLLCRAARGRRQPGDRTACRRALARGVRRGGRRRALRLLPFPLRCVSSRGRIPADSREDLRRRSRGALGSGVVRSSRRRDAGSRQLHQVVRRRTTGAVCRRRPVLHL